MDITYIIEQLNTQIYHYLPGGCIVPLLSVTSGFMYGVYRFVRSFKYLYYFYIEHGEVLWWMDSDNTTKMKTVSKTHKLNEHYINFGYVGGLMGCAGFAVAGTLLGSIWPIVAIVGVLTIPNLVLRHVAKEQRAKVVFKHKLADKAK